MKNNPTAVEWLVEQILYDNGYGVVRNSYDEWTDLSEFIEQAKAMEKEQITESHLQGLYSDIKMKGEKQAEQYYNETYGK
jgi:hypothetical protein